jgi:hypothetical protein
MTNRPDQELPPLGVRPKWLVNEQRITEIAEAITRYVKTRNPLPIAWVEEYNELVES